MWRPSPNFSSRGEAAISLLVLHYTGMQSAEAAIARLCETEAQVSAHYVVGEDGTLTQLVAEENSAWHAGKSFWRGVRNVNPISIGIEIVNPGHEFGYRPFPAPQMQAVAALCQGIIKRHKIEARNVVGHSDVAPSRKEDPGELFDWKFLAEQGVGLFPKPLTNKLNVSRETFNTQADLAAYGYDITPKNEWDEASKKVAIAFQRHFRQSDISGIWDSECDGILRALKR